MASDVSGVTVRTPEVPQIDERVLAALRERLPDVATRTVEAVTAEVPSYGAALSDAMVGTIQASVQMALAGFLKLATGGPSHADPSTPLGPTLEGAYALGRGEARNERSMDALLAAYRVGARVAWRELAHSAAEAGLESATMAQFAELLFAYIDELSAASVAGHTDELTTSGRVQERYRERLAQHLLDGDADDVLAAAAERAGWTPPSSLTAVLLPAAQVRRALGGLSAQTLQISEDLPGAGVLRSDQALTLLLVPDAEGPGRLHLMRVLEGRPGDPWTAPPLDRRPRVLRPGGAHGRAEWPVVPRPGADRQRGPPGRPGPRRRPGRPRRPHRPRPGTPGRPRARDPRAPHRDAALLAAPPGTPRGRRGGAARARPDRALPHGPATKPVRGQAE